MLQLWILGAPSLGPRASLAKVDKVKRGFPRHHLMGAISYISVVGRMAIHRVTNETPTKDGPNKNKYS